MSFPWGLHLMKAWVEEALSVPLHTIKLLPIETVHKRWTFIVCFYPLRGRRKGRRNSTFTYEATGER